MAELEIDVVSKASGDGLTKATEQVKELTGATTAHNTAAEAAATAEKGVGAAAETATIATKAMSMVMVEIATVAIPAMIAGVSALVSAVQQAAKDMQEGNLAAILHGQIESFDGLTGAASAAAAGIKDSFGDVRNEMRLLDEDLKRTMGNIDQTLQQTLKLIEAQKKNALAKTGANDPEARAAVEDTAEQQAYEATRQAKLEAIAAQKDHAEKSKALAAEAAQRAAAAREEANRLGDLNKATADTDKRDLSKMDEAEERAAKILASIETKLEALGPTPGPGLPDYGSIARIQYTQSADEVAAKLADIKNRRKELVWSGITRESKASAMASAAGQQEAAAKSLAEQAARDAAGVADTEEDFGAWDESQRAIISLNTDTRAISARDARTRMSNREVAEGRRAAVKGVRERDAKTSAAENLFTGKDVSDGNQEIYQRAARVLQQNNPALKEIIEAFLADMELSHKEIAELKRRVEAIRRVRKADKGLE